MSVKKAKEDKTPFAEYMGELKVLKKQRKECNESIKNVSKEKAFYNRATGPLLNAQKTVEKFNYYKNCISL